MWFNTRIGFTLAGHFKKKTCALLIHAINVHNKHQNGVKKKRKKDLLCVADGLM